MLLITTVVGSIILSIIGWLTGWFKGVFGKLIKFIFNKKEAKSNDDVFLDSVTYRNATFQIRIKEFEKIKVENLIKLLNNKLNCIAALINNSRRYEDSILQFDIKSRIKIDDGDTHKKIFDILSYNENVKYEVYGVFNTG